MSGHTPRVIVSRRNRPAKAALSRDLIVSTGLQVLQSDGLAKLSLRHIATALDTGPASLYVYVENLSELHALMLDDALAAVRLPKHHDRSWRDRLKALLRCYLHVLLKRPGLAQLALSTTASGPNALQIWEWLLGLLKQGRVEDAEAAWGVDLLTLYVTAIAAEQDNRRGSGAGLGTVRQALMAASRQQFPLLVALRQTMLAGAGRSRLNWALDVIVDGIKAKHRLS